MSEAARSEAWAATRQGLLVGAAALVLALPPARTGSLAAAAPSGMPHATTAPVSSLHADVVGRAPTGAVRKVADWVGRIHDNGGHAFVVLDKRDARVYVFDRAANLIAEAPVLLGFAPGDDSVDGIGHRPLSSVASQEKTTPAGRFEAERGHDTTGEDVVWIDYDAAVAMHRVRVVDPKERRLQRLASPDPAERRISFGCINVPVPFFEHVVAPVFRRSHAMVYVLPETKSLAEVFGPGIETHEARP